ncbi:MAG: DUF721 domain-containing protein [Candidatus Nitrospinota bacterium M3_3B_026]
MSKGRRRMSSVGAALEAALRSVDQANLLNLAEIERKWEKIAGPSLAAVSRPAALARRTLTIWVAEPVWADSMMYLKSQVAENVNAELGGDVVRSIVTQVRTGAFAPAGKEAKDAPEEPREAATVPESVRREIDRELSKVADSGLRSIIKRVMLESVKVESKRSRS